MFAGCGHLTAGFHCGVLTHLCFSIQDTERGRERACRGEEREKEVEDEAGEEVG